MKQVQLFADPAEIEGFRYRCGLFSPAEEKTFVRSFKKLPFKPFAFHGYLGNRRWRRPAQESRGDTGISDTAAPDPAQVGGVEADAFAHALVTEYAPGAGIGWHRDKPNFGKVVGLSFCSPCRLRFRRKRGEHWDRRAIEVAPRSGYLLDGAARHIWEHSITPMAALRYSVTFRTLAADGAAPE